MNQICTNYLLNIVVSAIEDDWTWKLQMGYALGVKIEKMKCSTPMKINNYPHGKQRITL